MKMGPPFISLCLQGGIPSVQLPETLNCKVPESIIDPLVNFTPDITFLKTHDQVPCVFRYMAGYIDQIVDHGPVPAPLYTSFLPGISPSQGFLPDHAQDVVGQYGQFQY